MSGNRGAPLRFCSGERDAPQFFPSLLRGTTSAAQRLSGTDSSARCQLFGWMQDSFTSCSDGETTPGLLCRGFLKADTPFPPLQYSSRLVFNKMRDVRSVRGDRRALSSVAAAWLKGNPGSPFHPVLLLESRAVCMQEEAYFSKVRLSSTFFKRERHFEED